MPSDEPGLTITAVARRLGVPPATLRTWERRYGVGPADRETGSRRRYCPADVAALTLMHQLIVDGVSPADAARAVVMQNVSADPSVPDPSDAPEAPGGRPGGGRVLAVPGSAEARGLARAALALDEAAVTERLAEAVASGGIPAAWDDLVRPVLRAVGERWSATSQGVEVEHLVSEVAISALRARGTGGPLTDGRRVLLACAPEEGHSLPLHALAAALAEHGVGSRMYGARLPAEALLAAVRRTGPSVVVVYSHSAATGDVATLAALPRTRPRTTLVAAGPGWDVAALPSGTTHVDTLAAAVSAVDRAIGVRRA